MLNSVILVDNITGGAPRQATRVRLGRRGGSILIEFDVTDDFIVSKGARYNDPLWQGDTVEAMFTLGSDENYLEIEVNPDGATYAVLIENKDNADNFIITKLDVCPFTAQTERTPNGWRARVNIQISALLALGFDGKSAKFNLFRQDYRPDGTLRLYAYAPTYAAGFHRPKMFAKWNIDIWAVS